MSSGTSSLQDDGARSLALALSGILLLAPATATSQELPRHKPRVTDPVDDWVPGTAPPEKPSKKSPRSVVPAAGARPADFPPRAPSPSQAELAGEAEGRRFSKASNDPWSDELPPGFHEIPVPRENAAPKEAPRSDVEDEERLSGVDEPGLGLGVEGLGGLLVLAGGISSSTQFGWGFAADWHVGRLFRPESYFYQNTFLELSWVHAGSTFGTEAVKVAQSQNHFAASALLGYTLGGAFFYGKLGPSLFLMPVTYQVQGAATDYLDLKLGLDLGVGVRFALYIDDWIGVAVRLEATGYRRGYLTDFFFTFGLGLAF